jgi:preprotein translocase subunit SecE
MANKITTYIKESVAEMKKVTWPTKKETKEYTLLVVGISVFIAALLGLLDFIFSTLFSFLINKQ